MHFPTTRNPLFWLPGCVTALAILAAQPASAQDWPTQPIKIVVGYGPGATPDLIARSIGQKMSASLGQPVIIENKPGANGIIAAETVMNAAPNGYTLWLADTGQWAINPALRNKLSYDPIRNFAPVSRLLEQSFSVIVRSDAPARSLKDLVEQSKSRPNGLMYGSSGEGTVHHLGAERIKLASGGHFVHIPYRSVSAQTVPALLSGEIDFMLSSAVPVMGQLKDGKVRLLARGASERSALLPDVPTLKEAGFPGLEVGVSNGLLAPAKTPPRVIQRLNEAVLAALKDPELQQRLATQDFQIVGSTPDAFAESIQEDIKTYRDIVKLVQPKVE